MQLHAFLFRNVLLKVTYLGKNIYQQYDLSTILKNERFLSIIKYCLQWENNAILTSMQLVRHQLIRLYWKR